MTFTPRVAPPDLLVRPVPIDPSGSSGPTAAQARGPFWRRSSPGLYVPSAIDRSVVEQRILEESCRKAVEAVTGWAALRLRGARYFDGLEADGATELDVDLVVPPPRRLRPAAGIRVVREAILPAEIDMVQQVPVTSAARATFDEARKASGLRAAVVVLDTALSAHVTTSAALDVHLGRRAGHRGAQQVRQALRLADDRCLSPKESVLRLIWCLDLGLPRPKMNWPVADAGGRYLGRPDLLSTELAVVGEFDGSAHRSRDRQRDDLRRDDRFRAVGLEPFRVVGADLYDVPIVIARIRQAIERARNSSTPPTWTIKSNPAPVA